MAMMEMDSRSKTDGLEWYVIVSDFNAWRIKPHNVFNHYGFYNDLCKAAKRYRDTEREQFEEQMKKDLRYYYWSKSEWEVLVEHWPPRGTGHDVKIDVFEQVMLNWDIFKEYVWAHRSVLRRRKRKGDAGS